MGSTAADRTRASSSGAASVVAARVDGGRTYGGVLPFLSALSDFSKSMTTVFRSARDAVRDRFATA